MNLNKLKSEISQRFFNEEGLMTSSKFNIKDNQEIKELIIQHTNYMPQDCKFSERLYCILHDYASRPKCNICNKFLKFKGFGYGFGNYCSLKCANNDTNIRKKIENTNIKKYGGKSPANSEKVRKKMRETTRERFGVDNAYQSSEIKRKIEETNLKKFGVKNVAHSEKIIEKKEETCLRKYGSKTPFHSKIIQDEIRKLHKMNNFSQTKEARKKRKLTNLERYGTEYPISLDIVREKIKSTNQSKFGVDNPYQSEQIKEKIKLTNQEKYNRDSFNHAHINEDVLNKLNDSEWLRHQHHELEKPTYIISRELGVSETVANRYIHKHGIEVKLFPKSNWERELTEYITGLGFEVKNNIKIRDINNE